MTTSSSMSIHRAKAIKLVNVKVPSDNKSHFWTTRLIVEGENGATAFQVDIYGPNGGNPLPFTLGGDE